MTSPKSPQSAGKPPSPPPQDSKNTISTAENPSPSLSDSSGKNPPSPVSNVVASPSKTTIENLSPSSPPHSIIITSENPSQTPNSVSASTPPPPPPSMKRKLIVSDDLVGSSSSSKRVRTEIEKQEDTGLEFSQENILLEAIITFEKENVGLFKDDESDQNLRLMAVHNGWIDKDGEERLAVYGGHAEFKRKVYALKSRFFRNVEKENSGEDVKIGMLPEELEGFELSKKLWGVKKRNYDGVFIGATKTDFAILNVMDRLNEGSSVGLFEKWVKFDDEKTYATEEQLLGKIEHLRYRYLLNLDSEIVASTRRLSLMAFLLSDEFWGPFYHVPVDRVEYPETFADKVRRIQSASRV